MLAPRTYNVDDEEETCDMIEDEIYWLQFELQQCKARVKGTGATGRRRLSAFLPASSSSSSEVSSNEAALE